ncbi:MAG: hypothetical protein JHC93_06210, partial [Parachlamydiales bacterium]|nr:hypothetical protein [Parachlamydiales bacterium]
MTVQSQSPYIHKSLFEGNIYDIHSEPLLKQYFSYQNPLQSPSLSKRAFKLITESNPEFSLEMYFNEKLCQSIEDKVPKDLFNETRSAIVNEIFSKFVHLGSMETPLQCRFRNLSIDWHLTKLMSKFYVKALTEDCVKEGDKLFDIIYEVFKNRLNINCCPETDAQTTFDTEIIKYHLKFFEEICIQLKANLTSENGFEVQFTTAIWNDIFDSLYDFQIINSLLDVIDHDNPLELNYRTTILAETEEIIRNKNIYHDYVKKLKQLDAVSEKIP